MSLSMAEYDSDDDDLTYSKDYRPTEEGMVVPAKEADFRAFLSDSGSAEEVIRLLVGLAESSDPPDDPVAFLRAKFDAESLPEMVQGQVRDDIPALLQENEARSQQVAQLTAQVDEAVARLEAREAAAHAALVDQLLGGGAYASDATEGALDLAKLYAAVAARFPAPAEPEGHFFWDRTSFQQIREINISRDVHFCRDRNASQSEAQGTIFQSSC